jgi:hypothetical protein
MKKSDLHRIIKEEIEKVLEVGKGKLVGKWKSPKGNFINKYSDDEGNEYIIVNGITIDLTDGNGSLRPIDDITKDVKSATAPRQSYSDFKKSMRGY